MDSRLIQTLFTLSPLEEARRKPAHADPRELASFNTLESVISHSLRIPQRAQAPSNEGIRLQAPLRAHHSSARLSPRSTEDVELLKKLTQYRQHFPLSSRILRPKEEEATP